MEGRRIARGQKSSAGVAEALNPRPQVHSDRNFIRDHIRSIKTREKELKEARITAQENQVVRGPSKKWAHVQSRVFQEAYPRPGSSPLTSSVVRGSENIENKAPKQSLHSNFGKVPNYLTVTKQALDDKKRQEAESKAPKVSVPEGHRMLPEQERIETIALLEKRKADVEVQIQKLPLRIETDGQKRRQSDLHKRIADIEQAIKFLNKPNVLIKLDQ